MMKNRGLIVFLIIILSLFALLILGGMIYLILGDKNFTFNNLRISSVSDKLVYEKNYEEIFDEININSDAGDIYIKSANIDEVKVKIYGDVKQLDVSDEDDLSIKYVANKCIGFCFNVLKSKIEITLPKEYNGKINIENKFGDTEIGELINADLDIKHNYGDISVEEIKDAKISNDCGDIEVGKVLNLDVENNYGDIEIKNVLASIEADASCGDIEIKKLNIEKNSSINSSLGDIDIGTTNDIRIDAHTSLGDTEVRNNNHKSDIVLSIDNSCGDITVNN